LRQGRWLAPVLTAYRIAYTGAKRKILMEYRDRAAF